jgi:hypothetical protein
MYVFRQRKDPLRAGLFLLYQNHLVAGIWESNAANSPEIKFTLVVMVETVPLFLTPTRDSREARSAVSAFSAVEIEVMLEAEVERVVSVPRTVLIRAIIVAASPPLLAPPIRVVRVSAIGVAKATNVLTSDKTEVALVALFPVKKLNTFVKKLFTDILYSP